MRKLFSILIILFLFCNQTFATWLSGYTKRIKLTTDHTKVDDDLTDFPVMVDMDSAGDYDYAESMSNGHDIRFTSDDGTTELSFERERHDSTTTTGIYWVKLDSVSSAAGTDFYVYYSTTPTVDGSNREDVWDSNYKAVYHMHDWARCIDNTGHKRPFYPSLCNPTAYYYNGNSYIAWQGDTGYDPFVNVYNHTLESWSTSVTAGVNPLTADDHGAPAIIVDDSGYIHVAYGSHGVGQSYAKSTNTEDITAWTDMDDIHTDCTYPRWVKTPNGDLYLFYRTNANRDQAFKFSTDEGENWSSEDLVIDISATYLTYGTNVEYDSTNTRMCMAWTLDNSGRFDLYYAYLDLTDSTMYTITGTDLGSDIDYAEMDANCRIDDSGIYEVRSPVLKLDSDGYPYIIYTKDSAGGEGHYWIYWNGSAWSSPTEIVSCNNLTDSQDFYITSTSDITAYLSDYVDIEEWAWNGSTWSETRKLTTNIRNLKINGFNYPKVVEEGVDGFRAVFTAVDEALDLTTVAVFGVDSDGELLANDNVTSAPFVMDSTSNGNDGWKRSWGLVDPSITTGVTYHALDYNGTTSYDKIPDHSSLDLTGTTEQFIEAWVNLDGDSVDQMIVTKFGFQYALKFEATGDFLKYAVYDGVTQIAYTANDTIDPDTWYYLIGRRAGNTLYAYVDNVVGTTDTIGTVQDNDADAYLGNYAALTQPTDGTIDEVRISDIDRGVAYGVATEHAMLDTLLTYGAEETPTASGRYLLLLKEDADNRYVLPLKD